MIKELSYNLPGYGFANCYLVGQAIDLLDMFKEMGLVEKMQNTCQLGTMKYVYPGAHHTRYEYVFTQLMLISNIINTKTARRNTELSLSSNLKEYEQLDHNLSGSALLQCLALLSNAGHMYDTFTTDKILIRLLKESRREKTNFYKIYKRNLPVAIRNTFDNLLNEGNYYKLHLFHIIHILNGLCRSSQQKRLGELLVLLVTQLIDPSLIKNEATERIFYLYKKIRKIAYLSVDMVYTPASFGANLNRMIYSIATYVDDLFDENSTMNKSIQQLEEIIHQQIYDSALCILNSARIEQEYYDRYKEAIIQIEDVFHLRSFLKECDQFSNLHSKSQPKAIKSMDAKATLLLSKKWNSDIEKYDLSTEAQVASKLPLTKIAFGTQIAQNLKRLYIAYGLISFNAVQKDTQSIIAHAISEHYFEKSNAIELIKLAIRSIYKYGEYYFNIIAPKNVSISDCVFIGSGSKKIAKEIRSLVFKNKNLDLDQQHEMLSCASFLDSLHYSGTILCFVGGIKANKYAQTGNIDEIDGFVYLPNRSITDAFAFIIEAKNYSGGEKDAEKQLKSSKKYLDNSINSTIVPKNKYAYMQISL